MRKLNQDSLARIHGGDWWMALACGAALGAAISSIGVNAAADVMAVAACGEWASQ